MTKTNKVLIAKYEVAIKYHGYMSIKSAYKYPSKTKLSIWHDIVMQCHELHGTGLTVVSYSPFMFTAAFKYKKDGKEHLVYFAPSYTKDIELEVLND